MSNRAKLAIVALLVLLGTVVDGTSANGHSVLVHEDESGWQCHLMGNRICGPGNGPHAHLMELVSYSAYPPNIIR